jgi:uncharacterized protein (DUF697 family)
MHHEDEIINGTPKETKASNSHCHSANESDRLCQANKIVKKSVLVAVGVGFIPFPIVDIFALTSIQLFTIKKLSMLYNIEFSKDRGKSIVAALVSSVVPVSLSRTVFSIFKLVPIIGYPTSLIALPALGGASTYAIGKVFIQHFEAGGTILDLDPEKVKEYFADQFKKGQEMVKDLKGKKTDNS